MIFFFAWLVGLLVVRFFGVFSGGFLVFSLTCFFQNYFEQFQKSCSLETLKLSCLLGIHECWQVCLAHFVFLFKDN